MAEQLLNIKFVEEVEKYPCLYNYTMKEYFKRDITEKAWESVGNTVNLTVVQAKKKWKNLRSVFVRHLRPEALRKKKKYYLSNAMQFAIPYIKTISTPSGSSYNPEEQDDEDTQESYQKASPSPPSSPPPYASPPLKIERSSPPLSITSRRSSSVYSNNLENCKDNKNRESESDEILNEFMTSKKRKKDDDKESANNNANKMFLLSLLPDMNSMQSTQIRMFKRQVIELIDNILSEPSARLSKHRL